MTFFFLECAILVNLMLLKICGISKVMIQGGSMAISSLFSVCGVRDVNDAEELLKEDAPDANVKLFVLNVGPAFKVGGLSGVKLVNPVWLNPFFYPSNYSLVLWIAILRVFYCTWMLLACGT